MKKIILSLSIMSVFILTGCGGGGGGSSSPSIVSVPAITNIPKNTGSSDTGSSDTGSSDTGSSNTSSSNTSSSDTSSSDTSVDIKTTKSYWETTEYNNSKLNRIGAWQAYARGYTGKNVTVAVIDTGSNSSHKELSSNYLDGISFNSFLYSESENKYLYDAGGFTKGQIEEILIDNTGSGYTTAPTVTVVGDGVGATAVAILNADGTVAGIVMTNAGTGYTYANIQVDNSGTNGTGVNVSNVVLAEDDIDGHGTAVASIIAGTKDAYKDASDYSSKDNGIQGVAYEAKILPIKIFDSNSDAYVFQLESALNYISTRDIQVANLSLGTNTVSAFNATSTLNSLRVVLDNNTTMVIASGNEGLDCLASSGSLNNKCSFPAATPWVTGNSDLLNRDGGWIVVGSVDKDNVMSWFSNKAGVTQSNYLVAPGEDIMHANTDGTYSVGSGTSYATPYVSGAVALMYQKYPHLLGNQISEILFTTATDLGEVGVDNVYGNGLLNLEKAFSPIGDLLVPTSNSVSGTNLSISNTKLVLPKIFGQSMVLKTKSLTSNLNQTMGLDDYGRNFALNVGYAVSSDNSIESFSFDNYRKVEIQNIIFGFSEIENNIVIGYKKDNHTVMIGTDDNYFGMESDGMFSIDSARSYYMSYVYNMDITNNINFKTQLDYGYAKAKAGTGLISDISDAHSLGYTTVLSYKNIGAFYSVPRRVVSGEMEFNIPVSRDVAGNVGYVKETQSLKTDSYETNYGLMFTLNKNLLLKLTHKDDLDNIKDLQDNIAYLSYNYIF